MKKLITAAALFFTCSFMQAQTFSWSGYAPIRDMQTDTIDIQVSGLQDSINSQFGIARVCFDIDHTYKSNLLITLISPSGQSVLLVENEGGDADNFLGTCLGMDGVPFELGNPPFTGTFLPTGNLSAFNNGQNPNGTWKFLVQDLNSPDTGSVHNASLNFTANPPAANGLGGSSGGPVGPFVWPGLVCPGGASGCELLPDVTASALTLQSSSYEVFGQLNVSNSTPNIGYGPLEIYASDSCFCDGVPVPCGSPCPNGGQLQHLIRQRIYRKMPGTDTLTYYDRPAGKMTYHPAHGHLHVDNWANYTLRRATSDPDPRNWPIVGTSVKQSYCLVNLGTCAGTPGTCKDNNGNTLLTVPNNGFGFYTGCSLNQGIYPGSFDTYSSGLNEPIILDSTVCNGLYYLVSITDPDNVFLESDETNNMAVVPIVLTKQNPPPTITSSGPAILCAGDSIILSAVSNHECVWSTGATTKSIVVKEPGSYTVTSSCSGNAVTSAPYVVTALPANAQAAVTVNVTSGSSNTCAGSPITFTATPTYGGDNPAYQWKVDNIDVGINSPVFTSAALTHGQKVSCVLTSNISCLANAPATSNEITINISPIDSFTALISQTRGYNPFCPGDSLGFKANAVSATSASYEWYLNGVSQGTGAPDQYISNSLVNGDMLSCYITAVPGCGRTATIGTGTTYNSTTSTAAIAYPTYFGNGRQQFLVRASELQAMGLAAGNITEISFVVGQEIGNPSYLNGYTIKLAQVPNLVMTSAFLNPAFTTVVGPVDYTPTLNSENRHSFAAPFYWDGVSSILVDICFSNQVVGRASYQNLQSNAGFVATTYYRSDGSLPAGACNIATSTATSQLRPNIKFRNVIPKSYNSNSIVLHKIEPVYHFTGSGNWDIESNWENNMRPPLHLLPCSEIIIDPAANGECLLNIPQVLVPGSKITVISNKKFTVLGDLLIQQ